MENQHFLKASQVAKLLGVSRRTVTNWTAKGIFPQPVRMTRKHYVWPEAAIEQWLRDRQG